MKKCWIPLYYNVKDTYAMSELFEKLAKKGWHFHKLNASSAVFVKGEKQSCRYTVDIFSQPRRNNDDKNLMEYRDLCAHSGWEYVDGYKEFQVFKALSGVDPVPLQSDDELACELVCQQQLRNIKSNIYSALSLIVLAIISAILQPFAIFEDDLFLVTLLIVPLGFIYILFSSVQYMRIKKNAVHNIYNKKNHLLANSIFSVILMIFVFGNTAFYLGFKLLHQESLDKSIYVVAAFANMLFVMHYLKRNEGRKLKTGKYVKVFVLCYIGSCLAIGAIQAIMPKPSVDTSRVIRMNDPAMEGTFTKSSSYFIPYQCEFVSDSGKYKYNLYIAKDSKTSELVYKALLHQKDKGNNELEPVNDNYEAEGYYLNGHTEMIFHIDTCVLIIKGGNDNSISIKRFNEQLSVLNMSY